MHDKDIKYVFKVLKSNINCLSNEEASNRLNTNDKNELTEEKNKSKLMVFLNEFKDSMIIFVDIFISFFCSIYHK